MNTPAPLAKKSYRKRGPRASASDLPIGSESLNELTAEEEEQQLLAAQPPPPPASTRNSRGTKRKASTPKNAPKAKAAAAEPDLLGNTRTGKRSPEDILKDLEAEARTLPLLHRKICDQLQLLQVEEIVLKRHIEMYSNQDLTPPGQLGDVNFDHAIIDEIANHELFKS